MKGRPLCLLLLVLLAALLAWAPPAPAGIIGSAHDFSDEVIGQDGGGSCGACHKAHKVVQTAAEPFPLAPPYFLWSRDLFDEDAYFTQQDQPDYTPGSTLACYDCHEDQTITVDDDPSNTDNFNLNPFHAGKDAYPQDIALDASGALSDGVGYYELINGDMPTGGINGGPTDGSPTGGHYWKRATGDISGTPAYEQGDKLDCSFCHDPHDVDTLITGQTVRNEVMFRQRFWNGNAWVDHANTTGLTSSTNTRTHEGDTSGAYTGRSMCAACHSYSNTTGYTDAPNTPLEMWGTGLSAQLPRPPPTIAQHDSSSPTPCTDCHKHNKISFSCNECHGFPPLVATPFNATSNPSGQSYAGGAGAHQRHLDALGAAVFDCQICHGPEPGSGAWHNEGSGTVTQGNVDIMGQSATWDPGGTRDAGVAGYTGTASAVDPVPAGFEFVAKGGGDQRCFGFACHGDPPNSAGALNWTDDMVDDDSGSPTYRQGIALDVCRWCHDATPAVLDLGAGAVNAPNVMGNASWSATPATSYTTGDFGARVNGHGLPAAGNYDKDAVADGAGTAGAEKDCTVCHDATYQVNGTPPPDNTPVKAHFDEAYDSAEKRLRDSINNQAVAAANDACLACHQNTGGTDDGTQVSTHGNNYTGSIEGAFTRQCRQCHEPHGLSWNGTAGTPRNLFMVGKWLDNTPSGNRSGSGAAGEEAVVDTNNDGLFSSADRTGDVGVKFKATSGDDSYDDGFDDNEHESICVVCHVSLTNNHNQVGDTTLQGNGHNPVGSNCLACHDHDFDDDVATADAFAPSGCEGCHNWNAFDPDGPGSPNPAAPNVMGNGTDPVGTARAYDDGTYGYNVNGHGVYDVQCLECHDVSDPPNTHPDNVYQSVWHNGGASTNRGNTQRNSNTAHLTADYFTPDTSWGSGDYTPQVIFDNLCMSKCHAGAGRVDMRHERDTAGPTPGPADAHHRSVQLGTHLTISDGDSIIGNLTKYPQPYDQDTTGGGGYWPIDTDITTSATSAQPHYVTCATCHDPHGTSVALPPGGYTSNFMVREPWVKPNQFCRVCHP